MKASKTTSDEVGKPGMPTTGRLPARANSVGLPGRMSIPWKRTPGAGRSATASAHRSFVPIEEPPDRMTASCSASRPRMASRSAETSSGTIPPNVGTQPAAATWAASAIWFVSRTWPGPGVASAAQSSLPVESRATRGCR